MIGFVKTRKSDFGFITDENGTDYFFHERDASEYAVPGDKASFETKIFDGKIRAINVILLEKAPIYSGKIKLFDNNRGFGFIVNDDGKDHFFHRNDAIEDLRHENFQPGDAVRFKLIPGKRNDLKAMLI